MRCKVSAVCLALVLLLSFPVWFANFPAPANAGDATNCRLNVSDDARTREVYPTTNYGSDNPNYEGYTSMSGHMDFYMKFPLSQIPPMDAKLACAFLYVFRASGDSNITGLQTQFWRANDNWTENNLTWNDKPSLITQYTDTVLDLTSWISSYSDYKRIPLNATDIQYCIDSGMSNITLVMFSGVQEAYAYTTLGTKEGGLGAYLILTFATDGGVYGETANQPTSQVGVIVDRSDTDGYYNYTAGIKKYLILKGMDYAEIDVGTTTLTEALLNQFSAIVIPQFNITRRGHFDQSELIAINDAVSKDGVGLIQVDCTLEGYNSVWASYQSILGINALNYVATNDKLNITISANTHQVSQVYASGEQLSCIYADDGSDSRNIGSDLHFENVSASNQVLAVIPYNSVNYPAVVVGSYGSGRVWYSAIATQDMQLLYGDYSGFAEQPYRGNGSLIALFYRGVEWAAKAKSPYVELGCPPFQTFRIDDGGASSATLPLLQQLLNNGYGVDFYMQLDDVNAKGSAYMTDLNNIFHKNSQMSVGPHAFNASTCLFYNFTAQTDYPNDVLATFWSYVDGNFSSWNMSISAVLVGHQLGAGGNNAPYMTGRGIYFTMGAFWLNPNSITYGNRTSAWVWGSPGIACTIFGYANDAHTVRFFTFCPIISDASKTLQDSFAWTYWDIINNVPGALDKTVNYGVSQAEHGLEMGLFTRVVTHDQYFSGIGASNFGYILRNINGNITSRLVPWTVPASADYVGWYLQNRDGISIENYAKTGNTISFDLRGTSNMPLSFYLWTENSKLANQTGLMGWRNWEQGAYCCTVGAFAGSKHVTITLGSTESTTPRLYFSTANITSTSFASNTLTLKANPIGNHTDQYYLCQVNCGEFGEPLSITADSRAIPFVYDGSLRIASFNVTSPAIGSNVNVIFRPILQNVSFMETGLPAGKSWNVTFNGLTKSSTSTSITFQNISPGTWQWSVAPVTGTNGARYTAATDYGPMVVPTQIAQSVTFVKQYYMTVDTNFGSTTPASGWFNAGSKITITATPPTATSGEQFAWQSWTGSGSGSYSGTNNPAVSMVTVNSQISEKASWTHKYMLTIKTSGLPSRKTTVSLGSFNSGQASDSSPFSAWFTAGSSTGTIGVDSRVSDVTGVRYSFTSWDDGATSNSKSSVKMDAPKMFTVKYKTQYQMTFSQSDVGSDFRGTVVTVDGGNYGRSSLPQSFWWDKDSTHSFQFRSPLKGSYATYNWVSGTGLLTAQAGTIRVSQTGSVIGKYKK